MAGAPASRPSMQVLCLSDVLPVAPPITTRRRAARIQCSPGARVRLHATCRAAARRHHADVEELRRSGGLFAGQLLMRICLSIRTWIQSHKLKSDARVLREASKHYRAMHGHVRRELLEGKKQVASTCYVPTGHPSTICCHDTSSTPSSSPTLHRLPTSTTTTTTPSKTDEAGRLRRAPLMSQRRRTGSWTDEAMDDADTIHTIKHAWRTRAKTDDDDHSSLIEGALAS